MPTIVKHAGKKPTYDLLGLTKREAQFIYRLIGDSGSLEEERCGVPRGTGLAIYSPIYDTLGHMELGRKKDPH